MDPTLATPLSPIADRPRCSLRDSLRLGPGLLATLLLTAMVVLGAAGCAPADDPGTETATADAESRLNMEAAAEEAAQAITAETLAEPIAALASDEMEGRGPGTEGDAKARGYLAERMAALGLEPAGCGGGWEQALDIVGVTAEPPAAWTFSGAAGSSLSLSTWDEFIAFSGVQQPRAAFDDAEVVFVGYGIEAPEYGWDDYKGLDVSGKVLLMLNNDPEWDPELFAGERRLLYGRWTYKYEIAAEKGAVAAIIHHTSPSAGYPYQVVQASWTGVQFELPAGDEPRIQVGAWTSEAATRRLAELAGRDLDQLIESARSRDFEPVPLGVTTSLAMPVTVERTSTANVLGLLPGRDPELADEVVVYSAHHDHFGIGTPDGEGDAIYNGALDNASGCGQLLAIAEAFTALPVAPRRSILFAFVAAEEQGLLGSAYYADHPTYPPGKMAANINYDGGNIWGRTRDVTYIGYGKSSLDQVVERYAGLQGRRVEPDQFPDKGYFYRSDQLHFARIGVPAIYLDNGTEFVGRSPDWGREQIERWTAVQYHQPSDEIDDSWSYEGMIDDARLGFRAGVWIAEQDELPAWNPGDEFEAARLEALAAVEDGGSAGGGSAGGGSAGGGSAGGGR